LITHEYHSVSPVSVSSSNSIRYLHALHTFPTLRSSDLHAGVNVHLVNTFQVNFHRVFGGGNIGAFDVHNIQAGVQRYGFTRTRGDGNQNHTLRTRQRVHIQGFLFRLVTHHINAQFGRRRVQNPQYDFFAPQRGQGVYPEVDGLGFGQLHLDPAVLRNPPLGNIHLRHYFQTGSNFAGEIHRRAGDFVQYTIGTVPHAVAFFVGFKVNIGRAGFNSIQQHFVHKAHNRCVIASAFFAVGFLFFTAGFRVFQVDIFEVAAQIPQAVVVGGQKFIHRVRQFIFFHQNGFDGHAGGEFDFINGQHGRGVALGDVQPVATLEQRQHTVLFNQLTADQLFGHYFKIEGGQIQQWYTKLFRGQQRHRACFYLPGGNGGSYKAGFILPGLIQYLLCLLAGDQILFDKTAWQTGQHGHTLIPQRRSGFWA